MGRSRRRGCALVGAALLACSGWSYADTFSSTWVNDGPGGWVNGVNWSTNPLYPNNGTHTFDATIALPNARVMLFDSVSVRNFTQSDGTFTGGGTLNVIGTGLWNGGTITGAGAMNFDGTLLIAGGAKTLSNRTINIGSGGSVIWSNGYINSADELGGGGVVNNAGTWQDDTDEGYFWGNVQTPVFNNSGTMIKVGGTMDSMKYFYPVLNNTGTVDVQGSGIRFTGGGTNTGHFNVAEGAMLGISDYNQIFAGAGSPTTVFSSTSSILSGGTVVFGNDFGNATTEFGGTYQSKLTVIDTDDAVQEGNQGRITFIDGASVNAAWLGSMHVKSGTVRFETGQASISFNIVKLQGGVIDTRDELFFNTLDWDAGTIQGDQVFAESGPSVSVGSVHFTGTSPKSLKDVTFFNGINGHARIGSGSLSLIRANFINLSNASFDIQGSAILSNDGGTNDGTGFSVSPGAMLIKSAGSGSAELRDLILYNDGAVHALAGTLRLNGGGIHNGYVLAFAGATLELGGGSQFVTHTFRDGGQLSGQPGSHVHISGPVTFEYGSTTIVDALSVDSTYVNYEGGVFMAGDLSLSGGSYMVLSPNADKTLLVKSLSMAQFSENQLDLTNNKMIVDYDTILSEASPAGQIREYLAWGRNGGSWDGEGIVTSVGDDKHFALGYAENSVLGLTSFGGYEVDGTSILIKYTYYGDANLDGRVNVLDLVMLANGWQQDGYWTDGDFDYNGFVDNHDLGLMALNWQAGNVTPLAQALEGLGVTLTAIPEPAGLAGLLLAGGSLVRPRRRK